MSAYNISWSHVNWRKFCTHLSSLKIPPLPYSKGLLKKIIVQIKLLSMSTVFHCTKFRLSKCNGSWVVSIRQYIYFNFQPAMFTFLAFRKSGLIGSCSFSKDLSEYKISWSYVDGWKFCIHLKSLNICHFGMIAALALKTMVSRSPSMAWPPYWIS
jgi:hypothetical protein